MDIDNDREWRYFLMAELKEIKADVKRIQEEMLTLKIKVATFGAIIGSVSSFIFNKIFS